MAEEKSTVGSDIIDPEWWKTQAKHVGQWGEDIQRTYFGKPVGDVPKPRTAEEHFAASPYRKALLEEEQKARLYAKTGGPAYRQAEDIARRQEAAQVAFGRMRGGGAGARRGTEAAGVSRVKSVAGLAAVKEATKRGYSRQEAGLAGAIALTDTELRQQIDTILLGGVAAETVGAMEQSAQNINTTANFVASAISLMFGGTPAKEGGVVPGAGSEDTFPARLAPGEIVIPKELSAQLMEVMSRSVGGGDVYRAQTGGVVRRDPQTGYLMEDQNAMALQTMALLKQQNERIEALEAGKKGKKKKGPMTGAEMKAEADRMAKMPIEYNKPDEPWGTGGHDAYARGYNEAMREGYARGAITPESHPLIPLHRPQAEGPWERGRPFSAGDKPPFRFWGSTERVAPRPPAVIPPSLDRAGVAYAEDARDQYPGWVDMERQYRDFSSGKHTETLGKGRRMREWREQAMPRGMPSSGERPYFLEGHPNEILVDSRFVPLEARIAKLEKSGKGRK